WALVTSPLLVLGGIAVPSTLNFTTYFPACGVIKSTRYIAFFLSFSSVSSLSQYLSRGGGGEIHPLCSSSSTAPVCSSSSTAYTTIAQDQLCQASYFILLRLHDLYL
ncbi:unnamed protein product, partial [Musa hybrid cultivar]